MEDYSREYSDKSFWEKVKDFAVSAGKEVIEKALVLYYCLQDPDTPAWAKAVIIGALGYFIVPLDTVPDPTPIIGFVDDLGAFARRYRDQHLHGRLRGSFGSMRREETFAVNSQPDIVGYLFGERSAGKSARYVR